MKKKFSLGLLAAGLLSLGVLAGCGGNGNGGNSNSGNPGSNSGDASSNPGGSSDYTEFSFSISLSNGSEYLNKGAEAHIVIDEQGGDPSVQREYSYTSSAPTIASVAADTGTVTALAKGQARIAVREAVSGLSQMLSVEVTDASPASGGYNFASLAGSEAINKRTEILGQLEKYAMDNHLTGITLFENGGYVKYSERVKLPTTEYITGYGFGLLSEGTVEADMAKEENPNYKRYLHSGTSQDPKVINARNDTGSQVSDLEGYITSSFWGTKLNATKDQYEWYPVLAKDTIKVAGSNQAFNRPVPVVVEKDGEGNTVETEITSDSNPKANPLGLYSTWRIYVKTGKRDNRLAYRYLGNPWKDSSNADIQFDGRKITLDDYEFAYRLLLTGSHNLKRGPEAAGDQTYGIVGAQRYFNNTKSKTITDAQAKETWDNMKAKGQLGVKTGEDSVNGEYIQLTILNPIDKFTAMYTLSSSLYSPLPEDFLKTIGGGDSNEFAIRDGAQRYGSFNMGANVPTVHDNQILDFTLSIGPYMLEAWTKNQTIVFKRNATWTETGRYNIEGVKLKVIDTSSDNTAIYKFFNNGELDSCGIPSKFIAQEVGQPRVYKTKGDATFKLNINSCTQERFDELFGSQGTISKNTDWKVKPWMSNDNFLNGLFYAIDRNTFAGNRGMQPSINYFSDAYLSDPENGISYNETQAHKDAIEAYQTYNAKGEPTFGYSKDRAILSFRAAVKELVAAGKLTYGTKSSPTKITIHIKWMYQTDVKEYGEEIAKYFQDAFNDERVSNGRIKLEVTQDAVTNWQDVYNEYLMKGKFDLGFGAISGNTYNPLNFLEVLKSDNSSGFTLNWGTDTSKMTTNKPLIYEDKMWSFDALWAVADHGGVVNNGEIAKTVEKCFLEANTNKFYEGGFEFQVKTKFIDVESAKLEITRIQIYVAGYGGFDVEVSEFTKDANGYIVAKIFLTNEQAQEINSEMRRVNKMDDPDKEKQWNETPFTLVNYGVYWGIEVSYSLAIKAEGSDKFGTPSESYVSAAANEDDWKDE